MSCHHGTFKRQGPLFKGQGPLFKRQGPLFKGQGPPFKGQGPPFKGQGPLFKVTFSATWDGRGVEIFSWFQSAYAVLDATKSYTLHH